MSMMAVMALPPVRRQAYSNFGRDGSARGDRPARRFAAGIRPKLGEFRRRRVFLIPAELLSGPGVLCAFPSTIRSNDMRSFVSTGLALALVTSLGLAACNEAGEEEDVNTVPPPAEDTMTTPPAATPPAEEAPAGSTTTQ
jgi:hypothetical protein